MIGDFFIWCAGTDTIVLSNCENSVRIKHIGLGTLVLIPAILGTISMSYALSTIVRLQNSPLVYISGGVLWGMIIFAFDRFIVSTHKKQQRNIDEFQNVAFYVRLVFAFVLGITVSHPFVLLYFGDSIKTQIGVDERTKVRKRDSLYDIEYQAQLIGLKKFKKKSEDIEALLTAEQAGKIFSNAYGTSSGVAGIRGYYATIKKSKDDADVDVRKEQERIDKRAAELKTQTEKDEKDIEKSTNSSYLEQVNALSELATQHKDVGTDEFFIMAVFLLVDILPLIFKTFAPFSLYDKILVDDVGILRNINTETRKRSLQNAYNRTIGMYNAIKKLEEPFNYNEYLKELSENLNLTRNIFMGLSLGTIIGLVVFLNGNTNLSNNQFFTIGTVVTILVGVLGNLATELLKVLGKFIKTGL